MVKMIGTITLIFNQDEMSDGGVGNAISSCSRDPMGRRRKR